ncbi:MAG: rhodanese-like domain-containing protein [Microcoleaceae cyanobacterium]
MSSYYSNQPISNQPIAEVRVEAVGRYLAEYSEELSQSDAQSDTQPKLQLIDVREPEELAIAQLEGFLNLPLSQYAQWSTQIHTDLEAEKETWVLCHHGMRSAQMCQWLIQQGFQNVKNISGGIDAYSIQVDRNVPRY